MKKFRNIAVIIATSIAVVSCNDAIDIVQDGEIYPQEGLTTVPNLENYLNGAVYTSLDNSASIKFTSLFTDELRIGPDNTGQDLANFRWVIIPNNGYAASIWSNNYNTINRVNTLVAASANIIPSTALETSRFNSTIAEARALRAYAYLELMTYFSTDTKNDNALGVMLALKPMEITDPPLPRVANSQIWAAMEDDLNFAYTNISYTEGNPPTVKRPGPFFMNKAGVNAIRARMYLYRGNYTLAKQFAQQAINDFTLGGLTLAGPVPSGVPGSAAWNSSFYAAAGGPSPYRQMWVDTIPGENIFKLARPAIGQGGIASIYTTNLTNINGSPLWTTGLNLFNAYSNIPNDIRRFAFVDPSSTNNFYVIDKYPGKGNTPLRNDIKIFRLTEMQLILAECAVMGSPVDYTTAATIVRNVRQARTFSGTAVLPVYTNTQQALRDILTERRVEFAFEGHRFIDLKRLGASAGVSIDRNSNDDRIITSNPVSLSLSDTRWTLPIPSSEINGNPTIVQNPGY
ncbi:RagB/SusD family nutrient uptake outer membrane protein [Chryseobacterium taihuense]|uniref:Starch-binding associating with outer membrane n=1 Tax=Chryseobacterium taihuense TaxID=1141221 RepID=A0ABY0QQW7_9FLAO|nr:RagB/SusD family nutrient uptake outer membrane protein [Chryseobacterium taihuense]SDL56407.1 Starch-binding associating with outer membrane [Chryseobacterium taihuense]